MLQEMPVLYYSVKEKLEISAKFPLKKNFYTKKKRKKEKKKKRKKYHLPVVFVFCR